MTGQVIILNYFSIFAHIVLMYKFEVLMYLHFVFLFCTFFIL